MTTSWEIKALLLEMEKMWLVAAEARRAFYRIMQLRPRAPERSSGEALGVRVCLPMPTPGPFYRPQSVTLSVEGKSAIESAPARGFPIPGPGLAISTAVRSAPMTGMTHSKEWRCSSPSRWDTFAAMAARTCWSTAVKTMCNHSIKLNADHSRLFIAGRPQGEHKRKDAGR